MHNGEICGFKKIRRSLLATLRDDLFEHISGRRIAVLFALVLNQLPDTELCSNARDDGECRERDHLFDYTSEWREVELDESGVYGWGDGSPAV